ncbi:40S ribosomal protein S28-like [Harpegnathos saltator]|nr:40S ribosomal protein S28-like [Harpegnathos saltator]XP_025158264.1 40S ribosomal protein S28-like [Harpegnathos saltator]
MDKSVDLKLIMKILGRTDSQGQFRRVKIEFRQIKSTNYQNMKGPVREGDLLTLFESEFEAK